MSTSMISPMSARGVPAIDVAADQVADIDLVVGEGGAFFRGDGDVQSAQGFGVVDGVDAGEFEDNAALVEPMIFELDFAGRGRFSSLCRQQKNSLSLVEFFGEVGEKLGQNFTFTSLRANQSCEEHPFIFCHPSGS